MFRIAPLCTEHQTGSRPNNATLQSEITKPDSTLAYGSPYFTSAEGKLGLEGFTTNFRCVGEMIRSISSMGTAPRSTSSPMTRAPTKQRRCSKRISRGPTYGTSCLRPSAVVASRCSNFSSFSSKATCSGIHNITAPVSTRLRCCTAIKSGSLGFRSSMSAYTSPMILEYHQATDVGNLKFNTYEWYS